MLACLALAGCGRPSPEASPDSPRREEITWGPVQMSLTFTPPTVRLDEDLLLDMRITAPEGMEVDLPALEGRLQGLTIAGQFSQDPVTQDGRVTRGAQYRLTPVVADEYRLAPLAVTTRDARVEPPLATWFPTPPVVLATRPLVDGDPGTSLDMALQPVWVRPPARTVAGYLGLLAVLVALVALAWKWVRRAHQEAVLRKLSPRERALRELDELLRRDLLKQGLVKDFYVELTMVVRRYIERQHEVRAPEQTTEEFLIAISRDPRFGAEIMAHLSRFLESADRVKFAAHQPTQDATEAAIATARHYVEQDAAATATPPPAGEAR